MNLYSLIQSLHFFSKYRSFHLFCPSKHSNIFLRLYTITKFLESSFTNRFSINNPLQTNFLNQHYVYMSSLSFHIFPEAIRSSAFKFCSNHLIHERFPVSVAFLDLVTVVASPLKTDSVLPPLYFFQIPLLAWHSNFQNNKSQLQFQLDFFQIMDKVTLSQ